MCRPLDESIGIAERNEGQRGHVLRVPHGGAMQSKLPPDLPRAEVSSTEAFE